MKLIRCFHYEPSDGRPVGHGCPKGQHCAYVHPDSPDWEEASPSYFTPPYATPQYATRVRGKGRGRGNSWKSPPRGRDRDDDYDDYHRSYHTKGPRTPSPPPPTAPEERFQDRRSRRDSIASSKASGHPDEGFGGPRTKMMDMDPPTTANEPNNPSASTSVLPTPPTTANSPNKSVAAEKPPSVSFAFPQPPTQPRAHRENIFGHHEPLPPPPPAVPAPPLPPRDLAPMQPPHPTPEFPRSLQPKQETSPATELDPKMKEKIWEERIKLLADCIQTRERILTLDEEIETAKNVTTSRFYSGLNEDDQKRLETQLDALNFQRKVAGDLYKEHQDQLMNASTWPTPPPKTTPEEEAQYTEILSYVKELNAGVNEMKEMLGDIATLKVPPTFTMPGENAPESEEHLSPMAVDHEETNLAVASQSGGKIPLPSRKRRRLSENPEDHQPPTVDMPTREELLALHELLSSCENDMISLRNDLLQNEEERKDRFLQLLDNKVDEVQMMDSNRRQEHESRRQEEHEAVQSQLAQVNKKVASTDDQVGELATNIADLILEADKLEQDVAAERQQREEGFQRILQIERRLQAYTTVQQTNSTQLQTLKSALNAYTSRPLSPPASPTIPSPLYIIQSLESSLIDAVRMSVHPLIDDLREEIKHILTENNAELYKTMWNKTEATRHALEMIGNRMPTSQGGQGPGGTISAPPTTT